MRGFVCLMALAFPVALTAGAEEKIESGLPVGAPTPPYQLVNVAGPFAGKTLCVR